MYKKLDVRKITKKIKLNNNKASIFEESSVFKVGDFVKTLVNIDNRDNTKCIKKGKIGVIEECLPENEFYVNLGDDNYGIFSSPELKLIIEFDSVINKVATEIESLGMEHSSNLKQDTIETFMRLFFKIKEN